MTRTQGGANPQSPFRPDALVGRVALVTGGASGIGFEIARQLGQHGAKVVLMGRRQSFLDDAVKALASQGIQASAIRGDVRSREDADKAVQHTVNTFGHLDTLINGAAGNFLANASELRLKGFKTVMEIDTVGVFNMSTAAFDSLKKSGAGVVVNISATLHYGATWFQAHASAAKAAIDSLTRSFGLEWGAFNIRVVGIAPGPIAETPGMTKLAPGDSEMVEEAVKEMIPLGRMGRKWDIALAAVYLISEAGAYVTGETLVVDGGHWLYKPPMIPRDMVTELSRGVEAKSRAMGATSSSSSNSNSTPRSRL